MKYITQIDPRTHVPMTPAIKMRKNKSNIASAVTFLTAKQRNEAIVAKGEAETVEFWIIKYSGVQLKTIIKKL